MATAKNIRTTTLDEPRDDLKLNSGFMKNWTSTSCVEIYHPPPSPVETRWSLERSITGTMQNPYCCICLNSLVVQNNSGICNKCNIVVELNASQKIAHNNNLVAGITTGTPCELSSVEQTISDDITK